MKGNLIRQRQEVIVRGIIYKNKNASIGSTWIALFITCISTISMSMWNPAIYCGITLKIMIVPTTCQGNGRASCSSDHVLVLVIK